VPLAKAVPGLAVVIGVLIVVAASASTPPGRPSSFVAAATAQPTGTPRPAPPNGTVLDLNAAYFGRMGSLSVSNDTGQDALVKLVPNGAAKAAAKFIVTNGAAHKIGGIADGTYWVVFGLGSDWDQQAGQFRATASAKRFDESFQFSTAGTTEGWLYTSYEITLHTVPQGTASTNTVATAEFDSF
jgi:hypothetical protein